MRLHPTPLSHGALILLLGALVGFGPLSIDMYLPSLPTIARDLAAPVGQVQLTIGAFLTGFCAGMLLYGPLSDRYGRRPVMIVGLALYVVASLACAFSANVEQLIALRVLQAAGGGAGSVLARAVVRDVFPASESARVLTLMQLVTMIAPLLAPLIGGWLLMAAGWRALFLALALFGAVCLAFVALRLPETHTPERRANLTLAAAFRAYGLLATDPATVGYILCLAGVFAGMFAYITGSPFVYIELFGVAPEHYGWLFGLNIVAITLFATVNTRLSRRVSLDRLLACEAALVAASGVALFAAGGKSLIWVVLPLIPFVGLTGSIGPNVMARLLQLHPERAGAAMALAVSGQFGGGMLASAAVSTLHDGSARAMNLTVAVCGLVCAAALVFKRLAATKAATPLTSTDSRTS